MTQQFQEIIHKRKKYYIYESDLPDGFDGMYYYMLRHKIIVVNKGLSDSEKENILHRVVSKIEDNGIKIPFLLKKDNTL